MKVLTYDTTLRDGAQTRGISFSVEDKLEILSRLSDFGMDFVEGGWPGSNPKDDEFFRIASKEDLKTRLVSFGSTRRHDILPEDDTNLVALVDCPAQWCCIFGKSWDFQVTDALRITEEENLRMISDSVAFLKNKGKHVMFDAEHFFDGFRSNPGYAMSCLHTAEEAGAEWVILCDTNGGSLPSMISSVVEHVVSEIGIPVGIHCHNDSELAVANSLAAISAGATMVQGTVNGIGERCGNANLCSVIPDLMLKMDVGTNIPDLSKITDLSRSVSEIANIAPDPGSPFVGERAFAHKGGMHVSALVRDTRTYEHVPPSSVGNDRTVLISDMAGRSAVRDRLVSIGIDATEEQITSITEDVKSLESKGYEFEGADASFELMVRRKLGICKAPFNVVGFRLFIDDIGNNTLTSEASIKVEDLNGDAEHTAADGHGPVDALNNALRKALSKFFPCLKDIRLIDYKVRVLDEKAATAAVVRVLIRSSDGRSSWTTVGVSENVIEASLNALVDSIEFAIMKEKERQ